MIRSSKISLKFTNTQKIDNLSIFCDEYKTVTQNFVDIIWQQHLNDEKISNLIPKSITDLMKDKTWLSSRAIQSSAKQASGIVRGTIRKFKQREYIYNKLTKEGKFKQARKLKRVIDQYPISKPELNEVNPELDSRFIKINFDNETSFDGWITLSSLGNKMKIEIPFKRTNHLNNLSKKGEIKGGIRISKKFAWFNFDIPDKTKKTNGITVGLDIGIKKVFVSSDNQIGKSDKDGWSLSDIQKKISRRKKGSEGFRQAQDHRNNFINWSLNKLNLSNVKELRVEKIKDLRRYKNTSRYMSHWTYTSIFDKIENLCEENGVQIIQINPSYTSQRCSRCGWVHKSNRKKEMFKCLVCGYATDSDKNASINIGLPLPPSRRKRCLGHDNRVGFYWNVLDGEPIVPRAQKTNFHIFQ